MIFAGFSRRSSKALILLSIATSFAASPKTQKMNDFKPDTNIYISTEKNLTGHPLLDINGVESNLTELLYGPLFKIGHNATFECGICTEQPSFENGLIEVSRTGRSSGRISVEIKIKDDAKWADGVNISGHDIVFSWQVSSAASKLIETPTIADNIISVSVPRGKPKAAIILMKGAYFKNKVLDDFYIIPRHLEQPIWEKSGKKISVYRRKSLYNQNPENPGLYYHHYLPIKVSANNIKIVANKYNVPNIKNVEITRVKSIETWMNANDPKSMFIDTRYSNPRFKLYNEIYSKSQMSKTHKRIISPTMYWEQGVFNQRNPIFNDKKIRKAILHSINWSKIAEIAGNENILTTSSFEPPFSSFYKATPNFIYSAKLANQLIKSAGWRKNEGAKVYSKGDEKLEFNMVVLKDNPQRLKIAQLIEKNLNEAGFKVTLYPKSRSFLMKRVIKEGRFTGLALYGIKMDLNRAPRTIFHSSEIPSSRNNYLGQNVGVWYSKDLDNSLDNLRVSISRSKREKYFDQIQKHYSSDIPGISLFYHNDFVLVPLGIRTVKQPLGKPALTTLPKWKFVL